MQVTLEDLDQGGCPGSGPPRTSRVEGTNLLQAGDVQRPQLLDPHKLDRRA
jgi:hypothetical protein